MKFLNIIVVILGLPWLAASAVIFLTVGTILTLFSVFTLLCFFAYAPVWMVLGKLFPSDLRRKRWPDAIKITIVEIAEYWRYLGKKFIPFI